MPLEQNFSSYEPFMDGCNCRLCSEYSRSATVEIDSNSMWLPASDDTGSRAISVNSRDVERLGLKEKFGDSFKYYFMEYSPW